MRFLPHTNLRLSYRQRRARPRSLGTICTPATGPTLSPAVSRRSKADHFTDSCAVQVSVKSFIQSATVCCGTSTAAAISSCCFQTLYSGGSKADQFLDSCAAQFSRNSFSHPGTVPLGTSTAATSARLGCPHIRKSGVVVSERGGRVGKNTGGGGMRTTGQRRGAHRKGEPEPAHSSKSSPCSSPYACPASPCLALPCRVARL